jgi:hypothetical protein
MPPGWPEKGPTPIQTAAEKLRSDAATRKQLGKTRYKGTKECKYTIRTHPSPKSSCPVIIQVSSIIESQLKTSYSI